MTSTLNILAKARGETVTRRRHGCISRLWEVEPRQRPTCDARVEQAMKLRSEPDT